MVALAVLLSCDWIENPLAVFAEVARPRECRGHRGQNRPAPVVARTLIVAEEEPLVLHDRAADRAAELVLLRIRHELARRRIGPRLRERIARLQRFILEELEPAAAERVRPGLGLHRNHTCRRLPELRVVILRRDLRLPDGLEIRVDDDDPEDWVAVLGAVKLVPGAAEMLPVHLRLCGSLRVLGRRVLPAELLCVPGSAG